MFSIIILNTGFPQWHLVQTESRTAEKFLNVCFFKITPFYHCSSDFRHFFYQRLEIDWQYFFPAFLQESCHRRGALVGCWALTFRSNSSHNSSIWFKSDNCAAQDINWKSCYSSLLLRYLWHNLLVCFGSLSCMRTNPWPTTPFPDGMPCRCRIM